MQRFQTSPQPPVSVLLSSPVRAKQNVMFIVSVIVKTETRCLSHSVTCSLACIVLSSTIPYPAGKPWKAAGRSRTVSTNLQSRCSSTLPGSCCCSPFRWNNSRCCWPSASTRLLKVTELILLSVRK